LIKGWFWHHPKPFIIKYSKIEFVKPKELKLTQVLLLFLLSITLVFGYINLVIHQMGFYELFFTDIMRGSQESKQVVQEFLAEYGDRHRHFGYGVFHGIINAFVFAFPFVAMSAMLNKISIKYVVHHFSYWLITSIIIGGLISEFV